MIRAVVDTNIFIRAIIRPRGTVAPMLTRLQEGTCELIVSDPLLDELLAILTLPRIRDKYHLPEEDIQAVLAFITDHARIIHPKRTIRVCRDPKDDMFLEAAVEGKADFVITGDDDLLVLGSFEGIEIVGPRAFLEQLGT